MIPEMSDYMKTFVDKEYTWIQLTGNDSRIKIYKW